MGIVEAIISGLLSCFCQTCRPFCQQLNYIRKVIENEQTMGRELDSLRSQKRDVSAKLNTGEVQHGKRPKEEKRSKKTVKILHRVKTLQVIGKSFHQSESIFIDSLPETSSSLPTTALHGSSAERKKGEILQCIMNPEVSKIGIFGMGGVGKTTIMRHIYNQLKEKKDDFAIVMWVDVSRSFNLEKIQEKIAEKFGCDLSSSTDETSRALVLHEAFKRRRNFVIFLDDVWESVSLQDVGIPEANGCNGSKIVWTTRFVNVCHSMESQREIKVECLAGEESWALFKEKVGGEDVIMSPEIEPIARKVACECGGLPLALVTVGRALRKEHHLEIWRNALQELKTSSTDQIDGMGKYVFGSLKFSYKRLRNDKIRSCFLYCVLFQDGAYILVSRLIGYWMAEGLIEELGNIQAEEDKGHAYLKELKDACMIQIIEDDDIAYVRMHDLIRDLAINITREQPLFMVKAGLQLKESPHEEDWVENLERVSLMGNNIKTFQGQPNCPQLSTLFLQHNSCSVSFSETFFKHMHNLRVLNLSDTGIESLPGSLSDLINLHALILAKCPCLQYMPSLAKLQKLRKLILSGLSSLKELPYGLENLVKLRHLDISRGGWGSFPSGALLKKSCLENLFMDSSQWRLSYESNRDDREAEDNSTFGEIIRLKNLTDFSVDFADVLTFNSYINKADRFELLKHIDFFVYGVSHKYDGHNAENESTEKVILPGNANYLGIDGCNFIQLSDIFHWDDLRHLKVCRIQSCDEMEWIGKDGEIVLPSLQKLCLYELHSFKGLCKEKVHEETLKNLRKLCIVKCQKLKYLIPIDLLENNLKNLEETSIEDCYEMENIISGEASATITILPKFKILKLWNLPELTSICPRKLVCDSLYEIQIIDCPKLTKLPFFINNVPPTAMRIIGHKQWWETSEWEDPQLKELLQPFFESDEMYIFSDMFRDRLDISMLDLLKEKMVKRRLFDYCVDMDFGKTVIVKYPLVYNTETPDKKEKVSTVPSISCGLSNNYSTMKNYG
ncbi:probable disease resistance protein At1g61300 [Dioscorea cayenensis subsp. rotundata]|uniref:Probable disease resistance protein At1g61300 n=1 Tax=Dioscorea cayennensis subsp. rotundata TaxID=55577 RepID=A0AB40C8Q2_DIOCR|nr:probable disease resistance protein At1g61300 [Dioscorea cayenensis subsp. rotundata]